MAWAQQSKPEKSEGPTYGREYYSDIFSKTRTGSRPVRMALVGKENCAKTGLALDIATSLSPEKDVVVLDFDSSADNTAMHVCPDAKNLRIIPLFDESDSSIFDEDNNTNWMALVEKVKWITRIIGEEAKEGKIGAVVFDGGSTFLKWCEFVMTDTLVARGVIKEEGDSFNQKEWRTRNQLFKDVINRINSIPVPYVFFTFHLKNIREFMDIGDGRKGLMKIGEKVDWIDGTQRFVSQQMWLTRYTKKGDIAAGVSADPSLGDNDWMIKCRVEEMKGRNMEHLGKEYVILEVRDGDVTWHGLPFGWGDE